MRYAMIGTMLCPLRVARRGWVRRKVQLRASGEPLISNNFCRFYPLMFSSCRTSTYLERYGRWLSFCSVFPRDRYTVDLSLALFLFLSLPSRYLLFFSLFPVLSFHLVFPPVVEYSWCECFRLFICLGFRSSLL